MVKSARDSRNPSRSAGGRNPSCFARAWRFGRNFCCLFGWYPVLVAPVVTAGFLLSLYSSAGCDFVVVDVGFVPSNAAYNESHAQLGFFFYKALDDPSVASGGGGAAAAATTIAQRLRPGCQRYSGTFVEDFVDPDRTWKVSRIMATISFFAGVVSSALAWLMVVTPLPAHACWPTVLLPLVMLSFIAEGSKFLIFDVSVCSDPVWLPSGVDSQPQRADTCLLGSSAIAGVVAGSLFLVSLLLVCLYTPARRPLRPDYGLPSSTSTFASMNDGNGGGGPNDKAADDDVTSTEGGAFDDYDAVLSPEPLLGSCHRPGSMRDVESSDDGARYVDDDTYTDGHSDGQYSPGSVPPGSTPRNTASLRDSERGAMTEEAVSSLPSSPVAHDVGNPGPEENASERVSESRLNKVKEMELLQSSNYYSQDQSEALSKLVSELDQTLSVPLDAPNQRRFL